MSAGHGGPSGAERVLLRLPFALVQIFPLSPGPRWQSSSARPAALALQQALGQELARVRQGSPEVTGVAVRLLQAIATLLNSPHSGALVMSMHRSHFLACPLMRQLCQYQVCAGAAEPGSTGAYKWLRCIPRSYPTAAQLCPWSTLALCLRGLGLALSGRRRRAPVEAGMEPPPLLTEAFREIGATGVIPTCTRVW